MPGFIDEAQAHVKAGDGGAGAVSFRREAMVPRGGPDGGDGGRGGDVYFEASHDVVSLLAFADHPHRRATNGGHGSGGKRHGRNGEDLIVPVPEGTIVRTLDGTVLADLAQTGDRLLAGEGGHGGRGNASFLSNRRRAPSFAEQGEFGEERWLNMELRLLADVALVGFPNAGKSTLISRISAARPKIADYPFTTLEPHLGVVRHGRGNSEEFIVADIPGLIEGASEGRGLGHRFLRHIERARVLVFLIDLAASEGRSATEQLSVLQHELNAYSPELASRRRVVVGSRLDLARLEGDVADGFGEDLEISAVTGEGTDQLVNRLGTLVGDARRTLPEFRREPVVHRPAPEGVVIAREGEGFVVSGRSAERAVGVSDLTNLEAMAYVQRRLKRLGVDRALRRAGAREGDQVQIGRLSFTYSEDE
jgi:GTPase